MKLIAMTLLALVAVASAESAMEWWKKADGQFQFRLVDDETKLLTSEAYKQKAGMMNGMAVVLSIGSSKDNYKISGKAVNLVSPGNKKVVATSSNRNLADKAAQDAVIQQARKAIRWIIDNKIAGGSDQGNKCRFEAIQSDKVPDPKPIMDEDTAAPKPEQSDQQKPQQSGQQQSGQQKPKPQQSGQQQTPKPQQQTPKPQQGQTPKPQQGQTPKPQQGQTPKPQGAGRRLLGLLGRDGPDQATKPDKQQQQTGQQKPQQGQKPEQTGQQKPQQSGQQKPQQSGQQSGQQGGQQKPKKPHYWVLKAPNNRIILLSQMYASKEGASNGMASLLANGHEASSFTDKNDSPGPQKFSFNVKAKNSKVIGRSELYKTKNGRDNGKDAVRKCTKAINLEYAKSLPKEPAEEAGTPKGTADGQQSNTPSGTGTGQTPTPSGTAGGQGQQSQQSQGQTPTPPGTAGGQGQQSQQSQQSQGQTPTPPGTAGGQGQQSQQSHQQSQGQTPTPPGTAGGQGQQSQQTPKAQDDNVLQPQFFF